MSLKRQNKKKKGFTLIELIIVIAIIAILAAIAIPNFLSIQRKSKVKADIASAKTIYDATSALVAEGKIVPETSTITAITPLSTSGNTDISAIDGYLQTVPTPESVSGGNFAVKVGLNSTTNEPEIYVYINVASGDEAGNYLVYPNGNGPFSLNGSGTEALVKENE